MPSFSWKALCAKELSTLIPTSSTPLAAISGLTSW